MGIKENKICKSIILSPNHKNYIPNHLVPHMEPSPHPNGKYSCIVGAKESKMLLHADPFKHV